MSCRKCEIINTGSTNVYISFRTCRDSFFIQNKEIVPFRNYNIWCLDGNLSSDNIGQISVFCTNFPPPRVE